MKLASWKAQLRKGAAELAVLAVVRPGPRYGLDILSEVVAGGGLELSEGTIYPLLARLQREGKVTSEWVEEEGVSHPRKYYRLSPDGEETLAEMTAEWDRFARGMDRLLEGRRKETS